MSHLNMNTLETLNNGKSCRVLAAGYLSTISGLTSTDIAIRIVQILVSCLTGIDCFQTGDDYYPEEYNTCNHLTFDQGSTCVTRGHTLCNKCERFLMGSVETDYLSYNKHRYEWKLRIFKTDEKWCTSSFRIGLKSINCAKYEENPNVMFYDQTYVGTFVFGLRGRHGPLPCLHDETEVDLILDMETRSLHMFVDGDEWNPIFRTVCDTRISRTVHEEKFSLFVITNGKYEKVEIISCRVKKNDAIWKKVCRDINDLQLPSRNLRDIYWKK